MYADRWFKAVFVAFLIVGTFNALALILGLKWLANSNEKIASTLEKNPPHVSVSSGGSYNDTTVVPLTSNRFIVERNYGLEYWEIDEKGKLEVKSYANRLERIQKFFPKKPDEKQK